MKLDQIFLITHRRTIEGTLDSTEITIMPDLGIVAHHLSIVAVNCNASHADGCTIDDGVI